MLEQISYDEYCQGYFEAEEDKQKENNKIIVPLIENLKEQVMKYKGITIHKRKSCNTWYTRFRKNGKTISVSGKTQQECYNKLKKAYNQTNQQNNLTITLKDWYNKWLKLYKIDNVKETTIKTYNTAWKHIPVELQLTYISKIKVEQIINTLQNCSAERVKQNLYDLLSMLFQKAYDNDIVTKNIMVLINKPKHTKQHSTALTNQEQEELINICKKIKNSTFLLFSMFQGLRRGEVLGLTRNDIDFENNTVTINKAWNYKNQFDSTKNKQSIRTMPLFAESKKLIENCLNMPSNDRIFNLSMQQHDKIIKKIKSMSTLNIKTKDMRATFITRCTELEIPEFIIQSWVGHRIGSKVTKDSYTTHNIEIDNKYINILNASKLYTDCTQLK